MEIGDSYGVLKYFIIVFHKLGAPMGQTDFAN